MTESSKLVQSVQLLAKADYYSRPKVLEKIAKKCGLTCLPLYQKALEDENTKMKITGMEILLALLGDDSAGLIAPLCNDKSWLVRRKANQALNKLRGKTR